MVRGSRPRTSGIDRPGHGQGGFHLPVAEFEPLLLRAAIHAQDRAECLQPIRLTGYHSNPRFAKLHLLLAARKGISFPDGLLDHGKRAQRPAVAELVGCSRRHSAIRYGIVLFR